MKPEFIEIDVVDTDGKPAKRTLPACHAVPAASEPLTKPEGPAEEINNDGSPA